MHALRRTCGGFSRLRMISTAVCRVASEGEASLAGRSMTESRCKRLLRARDFTDFGVKVKASRYC